MTVKGLWHIVVISALFLVLGSPCAVSQIQIQPQFSPPPLGSDTLCFRYQFYPADTLVYRIEAADSIAIVGSPTILRIRNEIVQIICDSVQDQSLYFLRIKWIRASERSITYADTSARSSHPWTQKTIYLAIDSLGHRRMAWNSDPSSAMIAPGGAFQPMLLPPLDTSCGRQNQSWLYQDTSVLAENGSPYPVAAYSWLWRVLDSVDTLGKTYNQIQYTLTGLGTVGLTATQTSLHMRAAISGYGKLSMESATHVLYHLFATVQAKVEITLANGSVREGNHHTTMNMHLVELRRSQHLR